ncbi:MAG TPA: hypothetical protein VM491_13990, partial [Burkholderiaceae bacterium]|nr:hypothetical protein [Burkholderiaceae bacterium]
MPHDIRKAGVRDRLPINPNRIHWWSVGTNKSIGFRRNAFEDSWWARSIDTSDPTRRRQHFTRLQVDGSLPAHAQWDAASKSAADWFAACGAGVVTRKMTAKQVCERHIRALRAEGRDKTAAEQEARLKRYVYSDPIANVDVSGNSLRKDHFDSWLARMRALPAKVSRSKDKNETRPRAPGTINRDMVPLRAAFNRAHADGLIASDVAWRKALKPIKNADGRRDIYLDRADRKKLLEKATPEVRPFLQALALLPLRPGAMAQLTVGDYNPRLRSLRIGKDKAGKERRITMPQATADFLGQQAKGKLPAAPLVGRPDGTHWNKDSWKWPIKDAVVAAELPPATSAYVIRHSV